MSVNKVNKTTGDLSLLAGGTLFADNPIGSIIPYGGATAPAGWFICDGTELVRATYPELFAVIGTSFGNPSDNTKFKLPDLREATTKGIGLTGKSNNHMDADGLALGEFIDDRMQEHTHYAKFTDEVGLLAAAGAAYGIVVRDPVGQLTGINASGRFGDTTEVKAVGVNYIIKAVSVGVPADFMSAVDDAVEEAISDIGTIIQNSGSVHPTTQADFDICSISVPAGTWIIGCFSELNFDGSASTYNNVIRSSVGNKTARTVEKNGGGCYVSMFVTLSSTTTFTAGGYGTYDLVASADNKQEAHIQAIRIK